MAIVESFSGVRGIYKKELSQDVILKYSNAYYELLKKKLGNKNFRIVIGRDSRESGLNIFHELVKGLNNCEIIDAGIMPTAAIENAVRAFNADGGIIITASHNEPEYNGFKFLDHDGGILSPNESEWLINWVHETSKFENGESKIIGKSEEAMLEYKNFLKKTIKAESIKANARFIVDPNGGAGIVAKDIFESFGIRAEYINMEYGKFKRLIEPNDISLKYLKEEMNKRQCDFAVGFDCDADRAEILLSDGCLVSGNDILALIADEIFSSSGDKSKTIVVNDATSYSVKEIAENHRAKWIEVEVGEINVVNEMIKTKAQIGGEGSNGGNIIPPSRCRDGILTILALLKLMQNKNKKLKELISELPKYHYIKEKIEIKEDFGLIRDKIRDYYLSNKFIILETGGKTGGLKAILENSWIWFRQSKTEDKVLRIIADSKDKETAERLVNEAKELLLAN